MFEVYLAGRIADLSYEKATNQRTVIAERLKEQGIQCRTPLRGKKFLSGAKEITIKTYINTLSVQEIILRDLHDIDRVNVVLILTGDDPSWGTTGEFWYATWIAKKPTIVISKRGGEVGGWLSYYATKLVSNTDEAIEVLKDWKLYWDNGEKVNELD
jgi:hypothetical protein